MSEIFIKVKKFYKSLIFSFNELPAWMGIVLLISSIVFYFFTFVFTIAFFCGEKVSIIFPIITFLPLTISVCTFLAIMIDDLNNKKE